MKLSYPDLLIAFIIFFASSASAIESKPFYFGLSNAKGNQVIVYENNAGIPRKLYAILPSGGNCLLNFIEKRASKPEDTGRQTASNFDNLEGVIFQSTNECLKGNTTIVLMDIDHLDKHRPIPVNQNALSPVDKSDISRIETARKLRIKSSWNLASLAGMNATIALIQFFPKDNINIACLALITKEHIVFEDYKGSTKNANSVWRVDDEGIFNPRDFTILAAFQTPYGYELVRAWAGAEGENSSLLREDGALFSKVLTQYRYWVGL